MTTPCLPLLALALALSAGAATAQAQEYKLVLKPEPGQAPPQRVCLASRSLPMAEARSTPFVSALAEVVQCEGPSCTTARGAAPARCSVCPEQPHPGCVATIELGRRAPNDYSVVCAEDDTRPPDGGTIYITAESVEAENPPTFYGLEVSGGRVRWSAIEAISQPSYRVMGGDFDPSPISYPRGPTDGAWVEVPIRRRCRCLDTRLAGVSAALDVQVDGAPICRGRATSEALLPVEVPATGDGRLRVLSVEVDGAAYQSRWSSRWPSLPIDATLSWIELRWSMPCMWPRPAQCPDIAVRGAECGASALIGRVCRYPCRVVTEGAVKLPLTARFGLDAPELSFEQGVDGIAQVVAGEVPSDLRYLSIDVAEWQVDVPGDRIHAVELATGAGGLATVLVDAETGGAEPIPLSGSRCGQVLKARLVGERDYRPAVARIVTGGRLALSSPAELAVDWDLVYGIGAGPTVVVSPGAPSERQVAATATFATTVGVRWRRPGAQWFVQPQGVALLIPGWPATRMTLDGPAPIDEPIVVVGGELLGGWSSLLGEQTVHFTAGVGAVGVVEGLADDPGLIDTGRPVGTAVVGVSTAILEGAGRRAVLGLDLRYGFVARTVHLVQFGHTVETAIIPHEQRLTPAHVLMLNAWLGLRE